MKVQDLLKDLPASGSVSKAEELIACRALCVRLSKMIVDAAEVRYPGIERLMTDLIMREERLAWGEVDC